ncbi:MAG TPA: UdgX family uracil-DNA binding protein [Chthoniobacterales bacterium]|jgi:DNA polymerase|nr:UdgX family uracil-DNA binding protein [Chthoniobacterales bacterium]
MISRRKKRTDFSFDSQPTFTDLSHARLSAESCKNCALWKHATQTVFGEGPAPALVMLVGEQPGDQEDVRGHPFVGPAGKLLNDALEQAGLDRALAYVTNAVKHFKWEPLGNRRLHKKPTAREIEACRPWLLAELEFVRPQVVVSLGATATTCLLGKEFRVTVNRGQFIKSSEGLNVFVTVHPSAILRSQDKETRQSEFKHFVEDLKKVVVLLDPNMGKEH